MLKSLRVVVVVVGGLVLGLGLRGLGLRVWGQGLTINWELKKKYLDSM